MKELSIEEKAKRYDEAIERAYSLLNGERKGDAWIYKLLPELAESEEEKLSKKLHECVCRAINNDKLPYEERKYISEKVIPYLENLEKRKEQKSTWSKENSCYYDDICEILINLINSPKSNVNKDVVQKDLDWLMSIKEPQLKREWREEDEKIRTEIVDYLERFIPHHEYDLVAKSRIWIDWLKKQGEKNN